MDLSTVHPYESQEHTLYLHNILLSQASQHNTTNFYYKDSIILPFFSSNVPKSIGIAAVKWLFVPMKG